MCERERFIDIIGPVIWRSCRLFPDEVTLEEEEEGADGTRWFRLHVYIRGREYGSYFMVEPIEQEYDREMAAAYHIIRHAQDIGRKVAAEGGWAEYYPWSDGE